MQTCCQHRKVRVMGLWGARLVEEGEDKGRAGDGEEI